MASNASQSTKTPNGGSNPTRWVALVVERAGDSKPPYSALHEQKELADTAALIAGGGQTRMHGWCAFLDTLFKVLTPSLF